MTVNGWSTDLAAPGGFIDPTLKCTAPLNVAAFSDPTIDSAITRAHSLPSGSVYVSGEACRGS